MSFFSYKKRNKEEKNNENTESSSLTSLNGVSQVTSTSSTIISRRSYIETTERRLETTRNFFLPSTEGRTSFTTSKPELHSNNSFDAAPFTRSSVHYRTTPSRLPPSSIMTSTANRINLNYNSPYANTRTSTGNPRSAISSTQQPRLPIFASLNYRSNSYGIEDLKEIVKIQVKACTEFKDNQQSVIPMYKTRSKKRGKLLLINNIKFINNEKLIRKGAELDETNLEKLFREIGFDVTKRRNLKKTDMEYEIKTFSKDKTLKNYDIIIVIVMSHGTGRERSDSTEVVCTDDKLLQATEIINQFDGTNSPHTSEKPKIFIFQCCRGDNADNNRVQHDTRPSQLPRYLSNMLVAYSTVPGFVSHRDPQNGTWYIQAICKVFMEHAHDTDIENLLKIVDSKLASLESHTGSRQTTSFENRGFKTCYLHPKKCE